MDIATLDHEVDRFAADLSEEVRSTLRSLFERDLHGSTFEGCGADARISVEYGASYEWTLTLLNASGLPQTPYDCLSFENGSLIKEGEEYLLSGEAEYYDDDVTAAFTIRFTDACVNITLTRADEQQLAAAPWLHLQTIAVDILNKYFLPHNCLNEQERTLLPLLSELGKLSYWARIPTEYQGANFPQLKAHIARYGFYDILPLVERLEKNYNDPKRKERLTDQLMTALNTDRYEPLWRELYSLLVASQDSYPSAESVYGSSEDLQNIRDRIQSLMLSHGYAGAYPNFTKTGRFAGGKSHAAYHIHCTESRIADRLTITFACGTALPKDENSATDIYSCLFYVKGRQFFHTFSFEPDLSREEELAQHVQIAVKKAEQQKLTKKEREAVNDFPISYWQLFFYLFVCIGGLFSIFMTIGFMLIAVLCSLIAAQPHTIPTLLMDPIWWKLFLSIWIVFDGVMGILVLLAIIKK